MSRAVNLCWKSWQSETLTLPLLQQACGILKLVYLLHLCLIHHYLVCFMSVKGEAHQYLNWVVFWLMNYFVLTPSLRRFNYWCTGYVVVVVVVVVVVCFGQLNKNLFQHVNILKIFLILEKLYFLFRYSWF